MSSHSAFLHPLPLSAAHPTHRCRPASVCRLPPVSSTSTPPSPSEDANTPPTSENIKRPFLPRFIRPSRLPPAIAATAGALLGAAFTVSTPFTPLFPRPSFTAHAASATASKKRTPSTSSAKELRYDGRQELDSREKAMSLTLTAGTFAALGVWAWKQNRRDDELENIRIREEVDRLEKLRKEFMDVEEDEDSLDDEDLLASLKSRISDSEDGDGESEDATDGEESGGEEGEDSADEDDGTKTDSVDMLRRMWDATDDKDAEKKKNKA